MEQAYRDDLAYIHDAGFGHFARTAAEVLLERLSQHGIDRGQVIDLGCGSGILSEAIAAKGFDILGIDLSPAHVELARKRVPKGIFRVELLLTAELPPCVAIACVGECLNYLFDDRHTLDLVQQTLARMHRALQPGGLLLFDVAEPGRVPSGSAQFFRESDDWAVFATAEEDRAQKILTRRITTFRKVGEFYRRDHECHRQRLLPRVQILAWLAELGFTVQVLESYGALVLPPSYVGFLARKTV